MLFTMNSLVFTLTFVFMLVIFFNRMPGVSCDIIDSPLNTAGTIGSRTLLTCKIDGTVQQWRDDYSGADLPTISSDDQVLLSYQGKYEVEGESQNYNLVLISAAYTEAGTHTCVDLVMADVKKAEIIVLESNASCTTNSTDVCNILIEGEYVHYMCNVRYKGLWGPKMTWSSNTGAGINPDDESDDTQDIKLLQHSYTTVVTSNNDGQSLRVVTSFDPPASVPDPDNSATNAPDYTYTWNSPSITVHYPPRDILFQYCTDSGCSPVSDSNLEVSVNPGDRIHASATANPNVDYYTWMNGAGIVLEGPDKTEITFEQLGAFTIECIVRNTMRGDTQGTHSRTIQVMVVATTTPSQTTTQINIITSYVISTSTQPVPCNCEIDCEIEGRSAGLGPGSVAGVAIGCLLIGALIPTLVFVIYRRQQHNLGEKSHLADPIAITNPAVTNTEYTKPQTRGEYEQMNLSPYINTRQDRPENNMYADLTKEETPYEQI